MSDVALREDVLVELDWPASCQWDDPECEVPATWIGLWPCCGSKVIMCDEHRARAEAWFARWTLRHVRCRAEVDHLLWMSLPRGGAS